MGGVLKSRTLTISIACHPRAVYEFVSNLENLPAWAKTFCRSVKRVGSEWIVETPQGSVKMRIAGNNEAGILDHSVIPAPGVEVLVPMRVVPNGAGSEMLFTLFQLPGMSDEQYAEDLGFVEQDLRSLQTLLERQSVRGSSQ